MHLEMTMERMRLGRWENGTSQVRMTRDQFLDLMAELIREDTKVRAQQLDVKQAAARRREGAVLAVIAMDKAGLLSRRGTVLVKEWLERSSEGLYPDLWTATVSIVPPDPG